MGSRLWRSALLTLGILMAAPAAGQQKQQSAKENSIESLFDGLPANLQKNVKSNPVRRDRVNDWLKEHVNGKGKTIAVRVPAQLIVRRANDGTYNVFLSGGGPRGDFTVTALGEVWPVTFCGNRFVKGFKNRLRAPLTFVGVSAADAEKLADLKEVTVKGKVHEAEINDQFAQPGIVLVLDDVRLDGKKFTSPKSTAGK